MTASHHDMNKFLAEVERRAFIMAKMATQNVDDALDIVQDAMMAWVKHYSNKPEAEWRPLFFRIVQNGIMDWHRKRKRQFRWFLPMLSFLNDQGNEECLEDIQDEQQKDPQQIVISQQNMDAILNALQQLPERQQQAFLLRVWEGMDIKMTAEVMQCSEGSVKTHLSRAQQQLRKKLGGFDEVL